MILIFGFQIILMTMINLETVKMMLISSDEEMFELGWMLLWKNNCDTHTCDTHTCDTHTCDTPMCNNSAYKAQPALTSKEFLSIPIYGEISLECSDTCIHFVMFECLQLKKELNTYMKTFILGMKYELKRLKRNQASKKKRMLNKS